MRRQLGEIAMFALTALVAFHATGFLLPRPSSLRGSSQPSGGRQAAGTRQRVPAALRATTEQQIRLLQQRLHNEERAKCVGGPSSWQARVARVATKYNADLRAFHADKSKSAPRVIVFRCRKDLNDACGGLGDSLAGLLSVFLIALRSERMLLIDWKELRVAFEPSPVFTAPEWQYTPERAGISKALDKEIHKLAIRHGDGAKTYGEDVAVHALASGRFSTPDSWAQFSHRVDVLAISNRASLWGMTHDDPCRENPPCAIPSAMAEMKKLGFTITPVDYGCILRFLFSPTQRLWKQLSQYSAGLTDPDAYTVSLHVRVRYNKTKSSPREMAMPFINCGDIITNGRPKTNHVRWYVASDVADVVHEFSTLRPDHMLNISEVRRAPCHIGTPACVSGCKIKSGVVREGVKACKNLDGQMDVFMEWLLLSLADTTVSFGPDTGYSKLSTAYSLRLLDSTWTIDHRTQRGACTKHVWTLKDETTWH